MNNLNVPSEPPFLQLPESLTTSPSQSTFMAEEDASICPLLPNTGSPPLDFTHPLTPSTGNDNNSDARERMIRNNFIENRNYLFALQLMIKLKMTTHHQVVQELELALDQILLTIILEKMVTSRIM